MSHYIFQMSECIEQNVGITEQLLIVLKLSSYWVYYVVKYRDKAE